MNQWNSWPLAFLENLRQLIINIGTVSLLMINVSRQFENCTKTCIQVAAVIIGIFPNDVVALVDVTTVANFLEVLIMLIAAAVAVALVSTNK